jgi:high-affinity K+ transport system ATPase subunit B
MRAVILVLRTFKGVKAAPTLAAVRAVNAAGDRNVHYIDTTGWITAADTNDGLHHSDEQSKTDLAISRDQSIVHPNTL